MQTRATYARTDRILGYNSPVSNRTCQQARGRKGAVLCTQNLSPGLGEQICDLCAARGVRLGRSPSDGRRGLAGFAGADDAGLVCQDHYLHAVAQPELGKDARDVALYGRASVPANDPDG
jgi:hypothetical protein